MSNISSSSLVGRIEKNSSPWFTGPSQRAATEAVAVKRFSGVNNSTLRNLSVLLNSRTQGVVWFFLDVVLLSGALWFHGS